MPQHVTKAPFAIPGAVEKAVIPSYENTNHIAECGLGEVEDPRNLRTSRLCRCRDRLLASQQTVQRVPARAALIGGQSAVIEPHDGRERVEWRRPWACWGGGPPAFPSRSPPP